MLKIKYRKYLTLVVSVFLMITLSLSGCSTKDDKDGNPAPSEQKLTKVTLMLDWTPNTNHTGLFVAQENGYFEEQGLEVTINNPSSQGTLEQLVATGNMDFGVSQQEQVTTARISKLPVVSLAAIIQHNTSGIASLKSKNILNAKDFENKSYGGWGLPSETALLKALMKKENADFDKINLINIGEADQVASLSKDIDLTWIFYGWAGIQAEMRNQELNMIWLKDIDPALDFYTPVIITNEKMIAEKPEIVSKMMNAISQGYEYSVQYPEQAADILIKYAPEADAEMIKKSQNWLSPQYMSDAERWGEQKESVWQDYAAWLYNNQLVTEMLDTTKAFTNDFLPQK